MRGRVDGGHAREFRTCGSGLHVPTPPKGLARLNRAYLATPTRSAEECRYPLRMHSPDRIHGHLTVVCGPMFAGKSTELVRVAAAARAEGRDVRAFKPRRDTRYDAAAIVTHTGVSIGATAVDDAVRVLTDGRGASLVIVDEAHFFGSTLVDPVLGLLAGGSSIVIAGLERDHRGEPFDPFPRLLCEADTVLKVTCPCARCGAPALHSQRLIESSERIVVGGAEAYEPRCRACFTPGK